MRRKLTKLTKTYPYLAELDSFDLAFAEELNQRHPSWLGYGEISEWEGEKHLQIRIPSPVPERYLTLSTLGGRLTVHFVKWHGHSYIYDNHPLKIAVQNLLQRAYAIMDERWIEVVKARLVTKGREKGTYQINIGVYTLEELQELPVDEIAHTCSWKGTHDKVYDSWDHIKDRL